MLVLSRRPDEKILLPTIPAVIKIISTQTGLARIGIEAPAHVPILREELCQGEWARQPKGNEAASGAAPAGAGSPESSASNAGTRTGLSARCRALPSSPKCSRYAVENAPAAAAAALVLALWFAVELRPSATGR